MHHGKIRRWNQVTKLIVSWFPRFHRDNHFSCMLFVKGLNILSDRRRFVTCYLLMRLTGHGWKLQLLHYGASSITLFWFLHFVLSQSIHLLRCLWHILAHCVFLCYMFGKQSYRITEFSELFNTLSASYGSCIDEVFSMQIHELIVPRGWEAQWADGLTTRL